jgi:hypothetical protein
MQLLSCTNCTCLTYVMTLVGECRMAEVVWNRGTVRASASREWRKPRTASSLLTFRDFTPGPPGPRDPLSSPSLALRRESVVRRTVNTGVRRSVRYCSKSKWATRLLDTLAVWHLFQKCRALTKHKCSSRSNKIAKLLSSRSLVNRMALWCLVGGCRGRFCGISHYMRVDTEEKDESLR